MPVQWEWKQPAFSHKWPRKGLLKSQELGTRVIIRVTAALMTQKGKNHIQLLLPNRFPQYSAAQDEGLRHKRVRVTTNPVLILLIWFQSFPLEKRVEVVNRNILECGDLLKGSDVVLLNNVFQWFIPPPEQALRAFT